MVSQIAAATNAASHGDFNRHASVPVRKDPPSLSLGC